MSSEATQEPVGLKASPLDPIDTTDRVRGDGVRDDVVRAPALVTVVPRAIRDATVAAERIWVYLAHVAGGGWKLPTFIFRRSPEADDPESALAIAWSSASPTGNFCCPLRSKNLLSSHP